MAIGYPRNIEISEWQKVYHSGKKWKQTRHFLGGENGHDGHDGHDAHGHNWNDHDAHVYQLAHQNIYQTRITQH